jgi:hypothetical protein
MKSNVCATRGRTEPNFGVREIAPAFSTADSSAVANSPRRAAAMESGDESPHSKLRFVCPWRETWANHGGRCGLG